MSIYLFIILVSIPITRIGMIDYVWSFCNYDFKNIHIFDLTISGGGLLTSILCTLYVDNFLIWAVLFYFAILLSIIAGNNEDFKKRLSNLKKLDPIRKQVVMKTNWKIGKEFREHFDAIMNGDEEFNFDDHFKLIAIFKFFELGGVSLYSPSLRQHPYYPEFLRKVEEIPLEKVLSHIDTWVQMTDRRKK